MRRKARKLSPAIEAQVRDRLQPNECVRSWTELRSGEVTVFLINKDLQRICKKSGRGAGMGRLLSFQRRDGEWQFLATGGWIS